MSGLPRPLAPWAALLAPLADDLQVTVGEWARRLAAALGSAVRPRRDAGEPDGFSGISRRGPYDRLLLTEWLLAGELPDEFTRRAAMGEHLFLDRARRGLGEPQATVALLDAGPDQLGTPRIAQLAALLVLAVRAEAAGVEFTWGVLQDPERRLRRGLGEADVRGLLHARSRTPPSAELAAAWSAEGGPLAGAEPWLVGGERFLGLFSLPAARLLVDEVLSPSERAVRVEVRRRGAGAREVLLPLPPAPACTRLLRDPFKPPPSAVVQARSRPTSPVDDAVDPRGGILFAAHGQRVAVRLRSGAFLDLHVPGAERERGGRARRRRGLTGFVAFGWGTGARHVTVRVQPQPGGDLSLRVTAPWGEHHEALPPGSVAVPGPDARALPCFVWPRSRAHPRRVWFLDARGTLRVSADGRSEVVAANVAALWAREALAFVSARDQSAVLGLRQGAESYHHELGEFSGRAFLGSLGWSTGPELASFAVESRPGGPWSVGTARPQGVVAHMVQPFPGTEVIGLGYSIGGLSLVVLEEDRRTFTSLGRTGARRVHQSDATVAVGGVDPTGQRLAYVTTHGELIVRALRDDQRLLVHRFEAAR